MTDNPIRRAWLRQAQNGGGEPPADDGRQGKLSLEDAGFALIACIVFRAIRDWLIGSRVNLETFAGNFARAWLDLTDAGFYGPPEVAEDWGRAVPSRRLFPWDAKVKLWACPDALIVNTPEDFQRFRSGCVSALDRTLASWSDTSFDFMLSAMRLRDSENLIHMAGRIVEQYETSTCPDEILAGNGKVLEVLAEAKRLSADPAVAEWAGDEYGSPTYWADRERLLLEAKVNPPSPAWLAHSWKGSSLEPDAEDSFLGAIDWDDDDPPPPADSHASPGGDGPVPAGQLSDNGEAAAVSVPVAGQTVAASTVPGPVERSAQAGQATFPTDAFPPQLANYCRRVAKAHVVDESLVGLAMLAVASAAMGNAWRLDLKTRFPVPPLLWVAVVARSGSNKTAPLNDVVEPLRAAVPIGTIENAMLNPQGRMVVSNATVEAVIARLNENPRGLLAYCNELAGWVKGFNAYKKSGGDEQAWLEFWDAKPYTLDRKTNNEHVHIPAASVAVLGGIQPLIFAACFDPSKFASGLVPRLLVTMPPKRPIRWTETVISDEVQAVWADAILWLRTRPFAGLDSDTGQYAPHVLTLTPDAKSAYISFYDSVDDLVAGVGSEHTDAFASKAREMAARIALVLQGMSFAVGCRRMAGQVDTLAATGGVRLARWCLMEQLRVFGLSSQRFVFRREDGVVAWMRTRGGRSTVRELHQSHGKRYENRDQAQTDLDRLVASGKARWEGKVCVLLE